MKFGKYEIRLPVVLAPMAGITDKAFRRICRESGADYAVSEMVSTRGMFYNDKRSLELMELDEGEHPVAIQLFGSSPEHFKRAARKAAEFRPDVLDINMGCPTPKIVSNGDGCALMKDLRLASEIIRVVAACPVPVSVKLRKGWDSESVNAVEFARMAEESGAAFLTVHGRTREQFYSPHADWEIIGRVKAAVKIPVIGNGDVFSADDAAGLVKQTGCDGVMIGRGALGNPWIFREARAALDGREIPLRPALEERLETALRQIRLMVEEKGEYTGMREARKHLAWYVKGIAHAASVKNEAGRMETLADAEKLIRRALELNGG